MSRKTMISVISGLALLMLAMTMHAPGPVQAQDPTPTNTPRPTPTNIAPPASSDNNFHGSIRGFVYTDVNGDGRCLNTGVTGETPRAGVAIEFVSSDEKTVLTSTSAENGGFELAGAGASYWRVSAQPPAGWVVTSANPLYAPIYPDTPLAQDVNFCVQQGTAVVLPLPLPAAAPADALLPESGAPANSASLWLALLGLTLVLTGFALHWREQRLAHK